MNRECFVRGRNWRLGAPRDTRHQEEAQHNTRSGTRENRLDTLTQRSDELVHHVCGMCMSESEESCESPSQHYMNLPTYLRTQYPSQHSEADAQLNYHITFLPLPFPLAPGNPGNASSSPSTCLLCSSARLNCMAKSRSLSSAA